MVAVEQAAYVLSVLLVFGCTPGGADPIAGQVRRRGWQPRGLTVSESHLVGSQPSAVLDDNAILWPSRS
jgi:hypothetical protein